MSDTNKARELADGIKIEIGYPRCLHCDRDRYCLNCSEIAQAAALLLQLADAHDRMAKDAARYRWLRNPARFLNITIEGWSPRKTLHSEHADAAIDAAMGADNG